MPEQGNKWDLIQVSRSMIIFVSAESKNCEMWTKNKPAFVKAKAKNDRLKVEHNAVLANQIFLTARYKNVIL